MLEQMLHAAADVGVHRRRRQRRQVKVPARKIDRVGQIMAGIGQGAVEVEHHQF